MKNLLSRDLVACKCVGTEQRTILASSDTNHRCPHEQELQLASLNFLLYTRRYVLRYCPDYPVFNVR
jgi:hypothetical protein